MEMAKRLREKTYLCMATWRSRSAAVALPEEVDMACDEGRQ